MIAGAIIGGYYGASLTRKINQEVLKNNNHNWRSNYALFFYSQIIMPKFIKTTLFTGTAFINLGIIHFV